MSREGLDIRNAPYQSVPMAIDLEALVSDARKALFFRDFEQALRALNRAAAMAVENGAGDEVLAPILRAIGDARCGLEDWQGAEAYYRESLARMEATGTDASNDAAGLLCNLGYALDRQERFDDSDDVYQRAIVMRTRAVGRDHPELVPILNNMAYRLMNLGDYTRARAMLDRALAIVEAHVPERHVALAEPLNNLGELARRSGDIESAIALTKRALAIMEENVPYDDHPDLAAFLFNAAAALRDGGREQESRELERRAKAIAGVP